MPNPGCQITRFSPGFVLCEVHAVSFPCEGGLAACPQAQADRLLLANTMARERVAVAQPAIAEMISGLEKANRDLRAEVGVLKGEIADMRQEIEDEHAEAEGQRYA